MGIKKSISERAREVVKALMRTMRSEKSKQLLIFLLFVAISAMFWILQSLNNKEEVAVNIPLNYTNVPRNIIFTNNPQQYVPVVVRDKGLNLINYSLNRVRPINVDFEKYDKEHGRMVINHSQLLSIVHGSMSSSAELVSMHADSILITFAERRGDMIRVRLDSDITPAHNFIQTHEAYVSPNTVRIYADSSIIKGLDFVETEPLVLSDLRDTTVMTVKIKPIEGVKIVPDAVTVTIPVEELIIKKMTLPISTVNFPDYISVITFPAAAEVSCFVPLSMFPEVDTSDFRIVVDYMQLNKKRTNKLPLNLKRFPNYVRNIDIVPDSIEYILEEKRR